MEGDAKFVWRGANEIMIFVFTHYDFPDKQFYAAKIYIHVTEEGEADSLFVLVKDIIPDGSDVGIGPLAVGGNNRTDGKEENNALILLSGRTSNLHS